MQAGLRELLARLATSEEYAAEQVASSWIYPEEYKGPAPIREQIEGLVALLGLSGTEALRFAETVLPTLTHPERFVRWEQLHTDCAGDEFAEDAGRFVRAPSYF